ncbi:DUF2851 family protein [uncultured Croceitalea sp.]|uniref:DUF2851 family protein n=1 Tax=uncultured Croceitalea sp. TaxID=1798908 RepID=UPI0033063101
MREDLLHFIWKTNKLHSQQLATTKKEQLVIRNTGQYNLNSGPDFFNSKIEIANQLWAGNVEIHLKSSDWYAHGHETDDNYDNVILHVVWEDDIAVFRKDKTEIPTLELKDIVPEKLLLGYKKLLQNSKKKFINCEHDLETIDGFLIDNWLERLYIERLEEKSRLIFELLNTSNNDWEKLLFSMLLKNFGSKVNGKAFLSLSESIDFSIVRKLQNNYVSLESVLFGMSGLLEKEECYDVYHKQLKKEYAFQKTKFKLNDLGVERPDFFGLRPNNFPTIRLSQFAVLYAKNKNLFGKLIAYSEAKDYYDLFDITAGDYWKNHFTFGKESKSSSKRLTKNTIDLILINTIVPLKFSYAKSLGKDISGDLISLMRNLGAEKNSIIKGFDEIGRKTKSAFSSQAKLQLYNNYCSTNQCLKCAVGSFLLRGNH